MRRIPNKTWTLPGWTPTVEHERKMRYSVDRLSDAYSGSEVYRGLAEPHNVYVVHFEEVGTYKVGITRHDTTRLRQHLSRAGASLATVAVAPNRYASQVVEGSVLRMVRNALVAVDDPLNGGTEHWDDQVPPPDLDALVTALAARYRGSEWTRTVWRLQVGRTERYERARQAASNSQRANEREAQRSIQRLEAGDRPLPLALALAIDDARENAGRRLVRLADVAAEDDRDLVTRLGEEIGKEVALVRAIERYRRAFVRPAPDFGSAG
ncbi:hypothetical protein E6C70_14465 [Glaciibacter flavus]|uniref:Uncharacterized protein n=1 Tax=Orlajensenia flava TaxID=2565934 RepID=A0A4S4FJS4_9MICO|nr:hypothetical protein [Glaciibacter flavus]THG30569.1 hypothetical protein E6C70_14465 [Glaciibacter flavus]